MNLHSTRRQFIKTSTGFLAIALAGTSFDPKKEKLRLSFSTLGCPDWSFDKIINFAIANNYSGIELRGIQRQMDLTQCREFVTAENIAATMRTMNDKDLKFVDLGSSAEMHHSDATERKNNLDEAKRFIDLAQKLNCPYIRVFPNKLPKEDRSATIDLIVKGLIEAGDHAKGTNVTVLMETHGDVVESAVIKQIMEAANHPKVGLVWDVTNMWTLTKEPPAEVYALLKNYIHHTHIKDAKLVDGTPQYKLMGRGEVPIFEAIDILYKDGYKGYYSFEWEKLWHPEIDEPEIALADYPKAMKQHFSK
ncbi:MAG: sugar phosphate isomerase/epimerase family protein [Chitinophagales bacterium]